jgi:hypothetical protein
VAAGRRAGQHGAVLAGPPTEQVPPDTHPLLEDGPDARVLDAARVNPAGRTKREQCQQAAAAAAVNGRSAATAQCDRQPCARYMQLLASVPYVRGSTKHRCGFLCTGEFASSVATHLMTPALFKVPSRTKDSTPCTITPDIQPILADTRN